jgi:hypothetical protein
VILYKKQLLLVSVQRGCFLVQFLSVVLLGWICLVGELVSNYFVLVVINEENSTVFIGWFDAHIVC